MFRSETIDLSQPRRSHWALAFGVVSLYLLLTNGIAAQGFVPGAPFPLNTNAATDSGADSQPQATTDGVGNWVAVWYSDDTLGGTTGTDNDILVSRSTDNGVTWTAPAALNTYAAT